MENILELLVNGFNQTSVPTLVLVLKVTICSILLVIISGLFLAAIPVRKDGFNEADRDAIKNRNIFMIIIEYIVYLAFSLLICIDYVIIIVSLFLSMLGIPASLFIIIISFLIKLCS